MPVTARETFDIGDTEVETSGVIRKSLFTVTVPGTSVPAMNHGGTNST